MSARLLVIAHTFFTVAMCGFMLAVQTVIYPQFRTVDPADFTAYATDHAARIVNGLVLLAPAEVVLALWLFVDTPDALRRPVVFAAGALLGAGWIATAAWYAPLHGRLQERYDADRIELLVTTNWLRTLIWIARAILACWFMWQLFAVDTAN